MGFEFTLLAYHVSATTTIHELINASYAILVNLAILILIYKLPYTKYGVMSWESVLIMNPTISKHLALQDDGMAF